MKRIKCFIVKNQRQSELVPFRANTIHWDNLVVGVEVLADSPKLLGQLLGPVGTLLRVQRVEGGGYQVFGFGYCATAVIGRQW